MTRLLLATHLFLRPVKWAISQENMARSNKTPLSRPTQKISQPQSQVSDPSSATDPSSSTSRTRPESHVPTSLSLDRFLLLLARTRVAQPTRLHRAAVRVVRRHRRLGQALLSSLERELRLLFRWARCWALLLLSRSSCRLLGTITANGDNNG